MQAFWRYYPSSQPSAFFRISEAYMKLLTIYVLLFALSTVLIAQKEPLPDVLQPPAEDAVQAESEGLQIFRLLPRGMFKQPGGSYDDKDNPIGIREGGAYYSFSTGSHSYNRQPQIALEQDYISVGFYGLNYGFLVNMGSVPVDQISLDDPQLTFIADHKPPHLVTEIRTEQQKRTQGLPIECTWTSRCSVVVGNTYVLRSIGYDESDIAVALNILHKLDDGSLVIAWRTLKVYEVPRYWEITDAELNEKLSTMLRSASFGGITGTVKDNIITLKGSTSRGAFIALEEQLSSLRPGARKIVSSDLVITGPAQEKRP